MKTKKKAQEETYYIRKPKEPEYILKVNRTADNDLSIKVEKRPVKKEASEKKVKKKTPKKKTSKTKNVDNPRNLPIKKPKKKNNKRLRKLFLLFLLFIACFITAVAAGYNIIFKLFEL